MPPSSFHGAAMRFWPKGRAGASDKSARYQRDSRFATATWVVLLVVIGMFWGWAHLSLSTARPGAADAAATRPASGLATSVQPMGVQLRAWFAPAEAAIKALITRRDEISSAAARNDLAGTGAACQSADAAVASLRQYLPSPDWELSTALQAAIDSYHVGMGYCIKGAQTQDGNDIEQAATYLRQGNANLLAAVNILASELDPEFGDTRVLFA